MFKTIKAFLIATALTLCAAPSWAALPWSSGDPQQLNSATPTCTYSSTSLACINLMTANVTSLTLAGMTAGTYYTFIWLQDGTGSRTLTQTAITGGSLATGTTAANKYDVWLIKATSASAATFIEDYPNATLWDVWNQTGSSAIAAVAATVAGTTVVSSIPSVVVPGMSASNTCLCQPQTVPGVNVALHSICIPGTNFVQCKWQNESAASVTSTSATINVRIFP